MNFMHVKYLFNELKDKYNEKSSTNFSVHDIIYKQG